MTTTARPSGLTTNTTRSVGELCVRPVSVTLTSVTTPERPETLICDGYGAASPAVVAQSSVVSLSVIPALLVNVAAGAAAGSAAHAIKATSASPIQCHAVRAALFSRSGAFRSGPSCELRISDPLTRLTFGGLYETPRKPSASQPQAWTARRAPIRSLRRRADCARLTLGLRLAYAWLALGHAPPPEVVRGMGGHLPSRSSRLHDERPSAYGGNPPTFPSENALSSARRARLPPSRCCAGRPASAPPAWRAAPRRPAPSRARGRSARRSACPAPSAR